MPRENYSVAIVGSSGRGKTYSLRNLDPKSTGFINIEGKPLPFKNEFKYYYKPKSWDEAYKKLIELAKKDEIKVVVLDSFSKYVDSLLSTARKIKRNYDIWNYYNEKIGELLYIVSRYPKDLFITAHTEMIETEQGVMEERIAVKGKEWKGLIEKEFTIVNYADIKITDDSKRDYFFRLNSDGVISAKTPPALFEEKEDIKNDCNIIVEELNRVLN